MTLSEIIQSIPVSVSSCTNTAIAGGMWLLLRRQKKDDLSIRIVNHTALLIIAWITFSVFTGLFMTFDWLEAPLNDGLFPGFSYGFRIAMAMMPFGILACCVPVIWFLRTRHAGNRV